MARSGDDGLAPRRAAMALLSAVLADRRILGEALASPAVANLDPPGRARAQRLAETVLRNIGPADRLLRPYLRREPPLHVMNVLRLGVVEVAVLGTPPHAAVSSAVDLVRSGPRTKALAGLTNAVMRRVATDAPPRWPDLPPNALPDWIRGPVTDSWGQAAAHAIEAAHARGATVDLTPGPGMTDAIRNGLGADILPTGSLRLRDGGQISLMPGYDEGAWWVQDAAAAIPARVLAAKPGELVLDLCAAPGGKTMQLAATGAVVTALDISDARMVRVRENLARTGLTAETVVADATQWEPAARFDAILIDAPCTATGTIRRHPDLPFVHNAKALPDLLRLQSTLIDRAVGWLNPGGRLVYATCSMLPAEGEEQAAGALSRHAVLSRDQDALGLPGIDRAWIGPRGLRLRPDHWADLGGMDGFFVAAFRRD